MCRRTTSPSTKIDKQDMTKFWKWSWRVLQLFRKWRIRKKKNKKLQTKINILIRLKKRRGLDSKFELLLAVDGENGERDGNVLGCDCVVTAVCRKIKDVMVGIRRNCIASCTAGPVSVFLIRASKKKFNATSVFFFL